MSSTPAPEAPRQRLPARADTPPIVSLRKLNEGERVSHWVKLHLATLDAWNKEGWRWAQIATAVEAHIDRPVTRNKLTGMVTMIRKGKLAKKIEA